MPTGYTAGVCDGTVTEFPAFALQCARAFGALILMRDEPLGAPIPEEFRASSHEEIALAKERAALAHLEGMNPEAFERAAAADYQSALKRYTEHVAHVDVVRQRIERMLVAVNEWTPPSKDHAELKTFMRQQLTETLKYDGSPTYDRPKRQSGKDWLAEQLERARRMVSYYEEALADERERTHGCNRWIRQLRESLAQEQAK